MIRSKILFIDDEKEILSAYESIFKVKENSHLNELESLLEEEPEEENVFEEDMLKVDYDIFTATQGEEGIAIFKEHNLEDNPFKIVFIDMRMPPGINGAETAEIIRALDDRVEIVIITAYSDLNLDEINRKVKSPDKLFYLKKPFYNEEIKQITLNLTVKYLNNEVKNRFVANVSHELRTPLASMLGFTKLLEKTEGLSRDQSELVSIIKDNSMLMEQLVNELLMSVQLQQKRLELKKETCNVKEVVKSVIKMMIPLFKNKKDVVLVAESCKENLICHWDAMRMKQVLINIVNNAYKFTHEGEVRISTELSKDGEVLIKIKDSGIGISEDVKEEIFGSFTRVEDKHHNTPGLGLGLNIVREIVEMHGGEVWVESELGSGSLFTLKFDQKGAA